MSTDPPSQAALYDLQAGSHASGELNVVSFEGREEINGLYSFDIVLWGKDLDEGAFDADVLGHPATLTMHLSDGVTRRVRGIVSSLSFEGRREGGRRAFQLTLVPRMWLLRKRVNSRIFQDLTATQIVDAILDEHKIAHAWSVLAQYPVRQYCLQYQESDYHFVTRILAEEGIFFCFEQPDGEPADDVTEQLVLGDNVHAYPAIAGDATLVYRQQHGEGSMHAAENQVLFLRARSQIESSAVEMRDYDFRRPLLELKSRAESPDAPIPLEIYDHHGEYEETDADSATAGVYLEQLRAGGREVRGKSMCRRLLPGHTFTLTEHEVDALNAAYVVTHLEHKGTTPEAAKGGLRVYENHFRAARAEVPVRPPRPPREIKQVTESAVVVGPEGQEIYTDSLGRIKVQFHWDREGKNNEQSSCWVRVMQPWAGTGWGFQFIPRIGMEVIVTLLGGDVDRPIVMGCVYNVLNTPSFTLPGTASRSGIRTNSTPGGGGGNELSFEDAAGSEELFVRAQRDLVQEIGNNASSSVGQARRETIGADSLSEVQGNREEITAGERLQQVVKGSTESVGQTRVLSVHGDQITQVSQADTLRIGGDHVVDIGGADVRRVVGSEERHVGAHSVTWVRGNASHLISKSATVVVDETCAVGVRQDFALSVGSQDKKATATVQVEGDYTMSVDGDTQIITAKTLKLCSGTNAITIGPDGIRLEGSAIILAAPSISAASPTAALNVSEKVEITGKTVKIWSADKAIVELDKDAKVDAATVKINGKNAAEQKARDDKAPEVAKAPKVSVQLFDLLGAAMSGVLYEVSAPGYIDRGTAGDGVVKVPKLAGMKRCTVRWGRPISARPPPIPAKAKQPEFEFEMEVYLDFDDDDPDENVRRKLHNLGHGDPRGIERSVASFQAALGVPITSALASVLGEVESRHDACQPVKISTDPASTT